jgi:uncharacterized protein YjbJ (UPF0337 family)
VPRGRDAHLRPEGKIGELTGDEDTKAHGEAERLRGKVDRL